MTQDSVNRSSEVRGKHFKGLTTEMQGHTFQLFTESNNESQYIQTVEVLRLYVNKTYDGSNFDSLFTDGIQPTVTFPTKSAVTATCDQASVDIMFVEQVKFHCKRCDKLTSHFKALFSVIWGQCSDHMHVRLKATAGCTTARKANNCAWLLASIRQIALNRYNSPLSNFILTNKVKDSRSATILTVLLHFTKPTNTTEA